MTLDNPMTNEEIAGRLAAMEALMLGVAEIALRNIKPDPDNEKRADALDRLKAAVIGAAMQDGGPMASAAYGIRLCDRLDDLALTARHAEPNAIG